MADLPQPGAFAAVKKTAGKRATGQAGTGLAIIDTLPSCGQSRAKGTWGGARNRADRTSDFLTLDQCKRLLSAAEHAERLGLPFNRHWTIHLGRARIGQADALRAIGHLLKLAREYAGRHGGGFAAIWTREAGAKGEHVHILMHFPARLSLKGYTRRWVRLVGGQCRDGASYIRAVAGRVSAADNGGEHYSRNLKVVREYLLKGASRESCEALGLERKPAEQGRLVGKRCGTTANIGPSAGKAGIETG